MVLLVVVGGCKGSGIGSSGPELLLATLGKVEQGMRGFWRGIERKKGDDC